MKVVWRIFDDLLLDLVVPLLSLNRLSVFYHINKLCISIVCLYVFMHGV